MPAKVTIPPGTRFGRLTVVREDIQPSRTKVRWICECDCGSICSVVSSQLRFGKTTSCGCWKRVAGGLARKTHGLTEKVPEYDIWLGIRKRCLNPAAQNYNRYGGRGIAICPEWSDFAVFYRDMGSRPSSGHSIERIDNDGPYSPENCRWATRTEQGSNKRNNRVLTYQGEAKTLAEWVRITGLSTTVIMYRIRRGWSMEQVLTTPLDPIKQHGRTRPDSHPSNTPSVPAS